jgi:hypothetical protein
MNEFLNWKELIHAHPVLAIRDKLTAAQKQVRQLHGYHNLSENWLGPRGRSDRRPFQYAGYATLPLLCKSLGVQLEFQYRWKPPNSPEETCLRTDSEFNRVHIESISKDGRLWQFTGPFVIAICPKWRSFYLERGRLIRDTIQQVELAWLARQKAFARGSDPYDPEYSTEVLLKVPQILAQRQLMRGVLDLGGRCWRERVRITYLDIVSDGTGSSVTG